jgi:hypothetical protein
MSNEFREVLARFRSRVDLWLNLWVLAFVFSLGLMACVALRGWSLSAFLMIAGTLALSRIGYLRSVRSAENYGEQVKAAFDIYLPKLANTLGFALPADADIIRAFWQCFGQMMVNPEQDSMDEMLRCGAKWLHRAKGTDNEK